MLSDLIFSVINYCLTFINVNPYWQLIIKGLIIVTAVAFDSSASTWPGSRASNRPAVSCTWWQNCLCAKAYCPWPSPHVNFW